MADSLESPKEDKADLENLPDVEKLDLTDHTGPPEEEEGKMDLKKLPFLPRLLIMKYLLQSDLRNLRQTCPEMYKSIEVNRLLKHEVFELKIIGRNKNSASNCAIKIRKKRRCNGTILPFLNFCDLNGTEEGASIWHESSLLRWIEEKLYSSKIEALEIEMMDFVEKEWIELVRLLDKVDMQVGKVTVNHCYINSKECTQLICFLTKLRPKSLVLIGNVFRAQHLFVKSFMEILPTFDSLDIMNYNWESDDRNFTVPSNFFKVPKP